MTGVISCRVIPFGTEHHPTPATLHTDRKEPGVVTWVQLMYFGYAILLIGYVAQILISTRIHTANLLLFYFRIAISLILYWRFTYGGLKCFVCIFKDLVKSDACDDGECRGLEERA